MFRCARMLWRWGAPELLPLAALSAVVLFAVGLYLSDQFRGGGDGLWYYCLMTDTLHQVRTGTFPVYVGQSPASWNGYPTVLVTGYLLTGVVIDLVTGGRLTVVEVQQLTAVWSVWAGALSAYFCLKAVSQRRWLAAALASVYVCCPALLSLLSAGDMYPALTTVPYYPFLLYGLLRGARSADAIGVALVGCALAALWMCHAGVALWCSTGTALFLAGYAVFSGRFWRTTRFSACAAALFLVLSCWYFGTVFELGIHRRHTFNHHQQRDAPVLFTGKYYADVVTGVIERSVPKTFLPLPEQFDPHAVQQLGYSLLALLAFAVVAAACIRSLELRLFVAAGLVLFVSVVPIPRVTWYFWAYLPRPFLITETWPMTRFGIVLGGVIVFSVALAAERLLSSNGRLCVTLRKSAPDGTAVRRCALPVRVWATVLTVLVLLGVSYSLREVGTIRAWVLSLAASRHTPPPSAALLAQPENQPLSVFNWLTFRDPRAEGRENVKDPFLYNRLLACDGRVLADNGEAAQRGAAVPFDIESKSTVALTPDSGVRPVVGFRIEPARHYLLTLRSDPQNAEMWFHIAGGTLGHVHRPPYDALCCPQIVVIPVWTTAAEPQEVRVTAGCGRWLGAESGTVRVEVVSLVSFDPCALPVRVLSLMPYTAAAWADRPCGLETHRQFVPGYEAWVNGERVEPTRSPDGMLVVPLREGENEVRLVYRGPFRARVAFAVSAIGWLALLCYAAYRCVQTAWGCGVRRLD